MGRKKYADKMKSSVDEKLVQVSRNVSFRRLGGHNSQFTINVVSPITSLGYSVLVILPEEYLVHL